MKKEIDNQIYEWGKETYPPYNKTVTQYSNQDTECQMAKYA